MQTLKQFKRWLMRRKVALQAIWWRIKFTLFREKMPKNADGKVYLNLGCGVNTSKEFVNIDALPFAHTHIVANIQRLPMFPSNSVDLIYASHVVEHIPRNNLKNTLKEWHRVLKPGGVFRFGVPNFDALIHAYQLSGRDTEVIVNQLLGQDGEYDDHHTIWTEDHARKFLTALGFSEVRTWNPDTADHHTFKDKSDRVMNIADQNIPISLNLEAIK